MSDTPILSSPKTRASGVPTGNAGEYFVMGELLRRGFDAQLADRNTKGYDILVSEENDDRSLKIQIKTVREHPWYIGEKSFSEAMIDRITVFVLLGKKDAKNSVRYFMVQNREIKAQFYKPKNWKTNGFISLDAVQSFENRWCLFKAQPSRSISGLE